jgi:hypothetical protein
MKNHKLQKSIRLACVIFAVLVSVTSLMFVNSAFGATQVTITVDTTKVIGSNKLSPAFMLDWEWKSFSSSSVQKQLVANGGLKLVRLFSVRIEPCSQWYESTKTGTFNWANVDAVVKSIFAAGAEPLICFGKFPSANGKLQVPKGMAYNPATINLPYPASYAAYVAEWVKHFKAAGLQVRYYEIVNEAYFYFGWDTAETKLIGNFASFFNTVARSIRSINPNTLLGNDAFLQKKFLNYFVTYGDNLDFIDFHKYGLTESGGTDAAAFNAARTGYFTTETACWYTLDQARQIWSSKRGKSLPTIITESNFSYAWLNGSDPRIQQMAGAVFTALVDREAVLRGIQYSIYYVLASSPTAQGGSKGYGMINSDNNQPWYPYYVQAWLGKSIAVGDQLLGFSSSASGISGFAWNHNQKTYFILICELNTAVTLYFKGLSGNLNFSRIDNTISYLTPKVQTGVVSSTQSLTLNGYTVAIFQDTSSTTPPPPPPPTTYFADGFESGNFGSWTGTYFSAGETVGVVTSPVHSGLRSGKFASNGGGSEEKACSYESVNLGEAYVRGYFYISSGLPLIDNGDRLYLLRLAGTQITQTLVYAGIRRDSGVDRWVVYVRNGANWYGYVSNSSAPLPQTGKWTCVELHWKMSSTQGLVELYVNNVKIISVSGINTGYYGNAARVDFGLPYAGSVQKSVVVYADDACISQSYIGL